MKAASGPRENQLHQLLSCLDLAGSLDCHESGDSRNLVSDEFPKKIGPVRGDINLVRWRPLCHDGGLLPLTSGAPRLGCREGGRWQDPPVALAPDVVCARTKKWERFKSAVLNLETLPRIDTHTD